MQGMSEDELETDGNIKEKIERERERERKREKEREKERNSLLPIIHNQLLDAAVLLEGVFKGVFLKI